MVIINNVYVNKLFDNLIDCHLVGLNSHVDILDKLIGNVCQRAAFSRQSIYKCWPRDSQYGESFSLQSICTMQYTMQCNECTTAIVGYSNCILPMWIIRPIYT